MLIRTASCASLCRHESDQTEFPVIVSVTRDICDEDSPPDLVSRVHLPVVLLRAEALFRRRLQSRYWLEEVIGGEMPELHKSRVSVTRLCARELTNVDDIRFCGRSGCDDFRRAIACRM